MARTVVGDHERFKQAYFTTYPGYYFTGDGAYRDKDGYYQITGRMDDVINVTGHRLGTAEVEDVLVSKGYTKDYILEILWTVHSEGKLQSCLFFKTLLIRLSQQVYKTYQAQKRPKSCTCYMSY